MRRRLPILLVGVLALSLALGTIVALEPRPNTSGVTTAADPDGTNRNSSDPSSTPESTDFGANEGEGEPAPFEPIDAELVDALTQEGAPRSIDSVFLADPAAQQDSTFQAYVTSAGLESLGEGLFAGPLDATAIDALESVPGLKVSRDVEVQLDPFEPQQAVTESLGAIQTVPQTDPALAAARTSTGKQGDGQVIAIVDSGVDTAAIGLGNGKVIYRHDFTSPNPTECNPATLDFVGHGTYVASIAAGATNSVDPTISGVAPAAKIVDLRVFGCRDTTASSVIDTALNWILNNHATYGITVVNLSLGGGSGDGTDPQSVLVNRLMASGLVVAVAAGNSGDAPQTVGVPGVARYATTVGAAITGPYGNGLAPYSSTGPVGDRPGVDLVAPGSSIRVARSTGKPGSGTTMVASGTSGATPYIAGLAALLRQQQPALAPHATWCNPIGPGCLEGVVNGTNPIQDLMVTSDWFAPGPDASSGDGFVSASASLLHTSVPDAQAATTTLQPGSPIVVEVPARPTPVTISVLFDQQFDQESILDFGWIDETGQPWAAGQLCWGDATGCGPGTPGFGAPRRTWNFVAPASETTIWLRLETESAVRQATISVVGLGSPLAVTSGAGAADIPLAPDGTGDLLVARTLAGTSATLTLEAAPGLLLDGSPTTEITLGGGVGDVVSVPVSLDPAVEVDGVGALRVLISSSGKPIDTVSVQLPVTSATRGRITVNGTQPIGGDLLNGGIQITTSGTIFAYSRYEPFLRVPCIEGGFCADTVIAVETGELDAHEVEFEQTSVSAMDVISAAGDGRTILVSELPGGAGLVPGDGDLREVYAILDRETGTLVELGGVGQVPQGSTFSGRPRLSETGAAAAFGTIAGDDLTINWWGGAGYSDHRELAVFSKDDMVRISAVNDQHVVLQRWDPVQAAYVISVVGIEGSETVLPQTTHLEGLAVSPDGESIATSLQSQPIVCQTLGSPTTTTFTPASYTISFVVADDCATVTTNQVRMPAGPHEAVGRKLVRITAGGTATTLAETQTTDEGWGLSPGGDTVLTFTGAALESGDTNGIYDFYRGALSSLPFVSATPTLVGEGRVGSTLTAKPGSWRPAPVTFSYQWNRNGVAIAQATGSSYQLTSTDAGKAITVSVTGVQSGRTLVQTSAALTIGRVITAAPVPTISGTNEVGRTLTASSGTWSPAPISKSYQWNRDGVAIAGASASTYLLGEADAGTLITVTVTGARAGYSSVSKTSSALSIKHIFTVSTPAISGLGRVGQTLTANFSTWSPGPSTTSYQWKRNGAAISGATTSAYKLTTLDAGKSVTVTITGKKSGYSTASTTSAVVLVERLFPTSPSPTITGSRNAGSVLTANLGAWSPAPELAYQWKRNGVAIPDATASTYLLATSDAGQQISVTIAATLAGYTPVVRSSSAITIAKLFTESPDPTITGSAAPGLGFVGATLTAERGEWSPTGITFGYQWYRNGVAIPEATASSFKVTTVDLDTVITVRVKGSKLGYTTLTRESSGVAIVKEFAPPRLRRVLA